MICPKCKNENPSGMKFCSYCGSPLNEKHTGNTDKKTGARLSPLGTVLRILSIIAAAAAVLFVTVRTQYVSDFTTMSQECDGHCVRVRACVESKLLGHNFYKYGYEEFNVIPPCPYNEEFTGNSSGFAAFNRDHEPATDENIAALLNRTVAKYQYDAEMWTYIFAGIAIACYAAGYFLKRREKRE